MTSYKRNDIVLYKTPYFLWLSFIVDGPILRDAMPIGIYTTFFKMNTSTNENILAYKYPPPVCCWKTSIESPSSISSCNS